MTIKKSFSTVITSDMSLIEVTEAIKATEEKYEITGTLHRVKRIDQGWLVALTYIKFNDPVTGQNTVEHWNYHPARSELTKTHETIFKSFGQTIHDRVATIESLKRLYSKD